MGVTSSVKSIINDSDDQRLVNDIQNYACFLKLFLVASTKIISVHRCIRIGPGVRQNLLGERRDNCDPILVPGH